MNGRRFQVYKFRTMVKNADELLKQADVLQNEVEKFLSQIRPS